ncbi:M10 family metallopeptidase [Caulobacter segnis]|uniref:M10 family metallopeptidase n=1 Tax=Caulobacter segnis TaxID=88688 RepID=UPI00240FEE9C|nr:M10 family metallopeptidase [Caulobacter segnis]MDG2521144.1 M10 family metallopeptidase [Caulobacter segnis]
MPKPENFSATGDIYVDGLLSGLRWATDTLTYSFPTTVTAYGRKYGYSETDKGFSALTTSQQAAVSSVLGDFSKVIALDFVEGSEAGADLRYARTGATNTAWAYTPHASDEGGDVWISSISSYFGNSAKGGYSYLTLLHETGHALGLKHTDEREGAFGVLPSDHDSIEYSVMSYLSYVGATDNGGYRNGTWDYPQTLMLDDIRALQHAYGARFDKVGETQVYSWSPTTGELSIDGEGQGRPGGNRVFMTVWTGGAEVTYDFSAYTTDLAVDLAPGAWSTVSRAQLARLDPRVDPMKTAVGNIANAYLVSEDGVDNLIAAAVGGKGNDSLKGNTADNRLAGGAGDDILDGREGFDTAVFSGAAADYDWSQSDDGSWWIADLREGSPDGRDTLIDIEQLAFSDGLVDLPPVALVGLAHTGEGLA